MKVLELTEFLNIFKSKPITFQEFLSKAQVKSASKMRPLKEYMKERGIKTEDVKVLFENIQSRNDYLTRFYNLSLRVQPEKLHITETPMKARTMNNNEAIVYKNLIRNMHYEDILKNTKSGIANVPTFFDVLIDLYKKHIIDYKILTPSAVHYIKAGRLGSVFSSFFFRASIMSPFLVYSLNESVLKGSKIFTPTLGWTSYCYGFLESPQVTEYVGTDVIPSVCEKTAQFAKKHSPDKQVKIFCKPSEALWKSSAFTKKYREHFDVVFFSPPYYKLEMYPGENQSTEKYKSYEEWLEKYWNQTIQLCHHVLEKGGRMCYILSGYGSENTKEQYDLLGDMNKVSKKYFDLKATLQMHNKDVHSTSHKETNEKIMVFVKK